MSLDTPNYMPVTVLTIDKQQLINMKWPEKLVEPSSLNATAEKAENVMNDARKRIQSGVAYKTRPVGSREGVRPITSVRRV